MEKTCGRGLPAYLYFERIGKTEFENFGKWRVAIGGNYWLRKTPMLAQLLILINFVNVEARMKFIDNDSNPSVNSRKSISLSEFRCFFLL